MTRILVFLFHLLSSIIAILILIFFTVGFAASANFPMINMFFLNLFGVEPNSSTYAIIGFIVGLFVDVILFGTLFVSLETNQNIRKILLKLEKFEKTEHKKTPKL